MKPSSSIEPRSPERSQPSVAQHLARRLLVLVVAGEDRLAADQELAVLGRAHLEARAAPGPTVPKRKRSGPVDGGGGRALGQAPALDDQDVERVEELADLLRERRAAGDAEPQPAAEAVLHLASRRAGRRGGAAAPARAGCGRPCSRSSLTRRPTASAQSSSRRSRPVHLLELRRARPCAPSRRAAARSAAASAARRASPLRPGADRGRTRSCSRVCAPSRCISRPKLWASGR